MSVGQALAHLGRTKAWLSIGEEVDAHFDGGEWSGPWHARHRPIALRRARHVARVLAGGITNLQLRRLVDAHWRAIRRVEMEEYR